MADKVYVLSEDDARTLREMRAALKALRPFLFPGAPMGPGQAPSTHIVKTPDGGIPPRVGRQLGCATCDVYKLVDLGSEAEEADCDTPQKLEAVLLSDDTPYSLLVYNPSLDTIEDEYIQVTRDKYGTWLPSVPGSTGVQMIRFELTDDIHCDLCQAQAIVLSRPPGVARVYGEDDYGQVMVVDLARGFLNEPYDDLAGRRGYAVLLEMENTECALDPSVLIYWEIVSLICAESGCSYT